MAANPFPLLPQYQGDYLDAQRKQLIAQALQEQAMTPMSADQPGWNQMRIVPRASVLSGLSKVGQALLAGYAGNRAVDAQRALGQEQWQGMQGLFGGGQAPPQTSGDGAQSPQGGMQQGNNTSTTAPTSPLNPAGLPPSAAAMAYMTDPSGYMKDMVGPYYKPTDATLMARQGGQNVQDANIAALAHANNIAPVEGRAGGYTYMPSMGPDGKVSYTPQFNQPIPQGGMPVYDAQGRLAGTLPLPGAPQVAGQMAGATAGAQAAYKPVSGFDANGRPTFTTAGAIANGVNNPSAQFPGYQAPGMPPSANAGQPQGANGAIAPSLPVGTDQLVKGYVQRQQDIAQAAQNAPRDIQAFRQIDQAAANAKTGAGFDKGAYWKSMASVIPGISPNNTDKTNMDIIHKYSEQIATRNGGRSDAALEAAMSSITNSGMSPAAIHELTPSLIGQRMSDIGQYNARQNWLRSHGNSPMALGDFEQHWNQSYDPEVYRYQAMSLPQKQAYVQGLTPAQRASLKNSQMQLQQMGAIPNL